MKYITSRDNALVKKLRGLVQDSREVRKQGQTVLDGPHLVATYLERIGSPECLVVSESGMQSSEVQAIVERHAPLKPFCLKDSVFKEIAPSESPVGVLSLIWIPDTSPWKSGTDCVLLDAVQDAGNVGTILRSAAAFGIGHVFLGAGCAGAWTPKVLRAAQGAHFSLSVHERSDLASVLSSFQGLKVAAVVKDAVSIYSLKFEAPVAWVIGSEGQGVAPEFLQLCNERATIPMVKECESLNAAVAASICLAEMARQKGRHGRL